MHSGLRVIVGEAGMDAGVKVNSKSRTTGEMKRPHRVAGKRVTFMSASCSS